MKIALATMALARSEWPFIAGWIRYHASLGVERFFIANDGPRARIYRRRKPWGNYWPNLKDYEVMERFRENVFRAAQESGAEVFYTESGYGLGADKDQIPRQLRLFKSVARMTQADDWWGLLDVDEFLKPSRPLDVILREVPPCMRAVHLKQKLFAARWTIEGQVRPIHGIKRHFGVLGFGGKFLARGGEVSQTGNIHEPAPAVPLKELDPEDLRIHHYRGNGGNGVWKTLTEHPDDDSL